MAKLLPVKIYPDQILRQKVRNIEVAELRRPILKQLILDMEKTMKEKDGIGLAAPQIGQSINLTVINTESGALALVNPRIIRKSWKKETDEEGCLSLPQVFGLVKRSFKAKVSALNKDGKKINFVAKGLFARVIQHEVDHLNGILFIDKAKKITKGQEQLKAYEKHQA